MDHKINRQCSGSCSVAPSYPNQANATVTSPTRFTFLAHHGSVCGKKHKSLSEDCVNEANKKKEKRESMKQKVGVDAMSCEDVGRGEMGEYGKGARG